MLKKILVTIYLVHEIDTFKKLSKAFTLVIFYMDTQVSILKIKKWYVNFYPHTNSWNIIINMYVNKINHQYRQYKPVMLHYTDPEREKFKQNQHVPYTVQ